MTPDELAALTTRVIDLLVDSSNCLCSDEDVPCLKHERTAFEVYFVAKWGVGPFQWVRDIDGGTRGHLYLWNPLYVLPLGGGGKITHDYSLLERLGLPTGYVEFDKASVSWTVHQYLPAIQVQGPDLREVLMNYRGMMAAWEKALFRGKGSSELVPARATNAAKVLSP